MASEDTCSSITVELPLLVGTVDSEEQLGENGLKNIGDYLRLNLSKLQEYVRKKKDLNFVSIVDVIFHNKLIQVVFEVFDETQLNKLFDCLRTKDNLLSTYLSQYFFEKSLEVVAGLTKTECIDCNLLMPKSLFHKCSAKLSELEENNALKRFDNEKLQQSRRTTEKQIVAKSEILVSTSNVQQKVQEINEMVSTSNERNQLENHSDQRREGSNIQNKSTLTVGTTESESQPRRCPNSGEETGSQPGSYPYNKMERGITTTDRLNQDPKIPSNEGTSKDKHANKKQDTEDDLTPVVRKQFIFYHPPLPKRWKISRIYIESETFKLLNTDLTTHFGDLFEATINIPLKFLERQESMSFRYVVVRRMTGLFGNFLSEIYERSKLFYVESSSCQRHLWNQINPKPTQLEIASGYKEHLEDIMFHCASKQDCKETCIEIENFCKTYLLKEHAITILKQLACELIDTGYHPIASLLFLITVKSLVTRHELIVTEKLVDAKHAQKLLQAIQSLSISSLPASSRRDILSVCHQFCRIALGDKMCVLTYLSSCYPFYDERYVLDRIESYVTSSVSICLDSESMFPFANELCSKLYRVAVSDSSNTAKSILEKLLRHIPLQVALHVFACLNKDNENLSSNESDVQSVLYGSVSVRVEKMINSARKSNNLTKLLTGWRDIERFEVLTAKFKCKYEDAVIQILESHNGLLESVSDIVGGFIDQSGFFKEPSKQRQLIGAVVKSKRHEISKLFVTLANSSTLYELYMQLEAEQFKELCVSYITGNSQYMSREFAFRYVCEHLNDIWGIQQMERRHDFQEVWDNILFNELQKYRLRELLQNLKVIDKLSRTNEHLGMVFLQYVRSNLQSNYEGFPPEEIFRWFGGTSEKPQVETRMSALVLNVLIDTYGRLLPERSVFENFRQLIEQFKFWQSLYSCHGPYIDIINENGKISDVKDCIIKMVDLFNKNEVSYDFVVDIDNNTQLCRAAKSLLQLECKREEINQYWSEALMKFKEEKEKLHRVQKVITIVCSKLNTKDFLESFRNITKRLNNAEAQLVSGKMTAKECIQNNSIWKGMEQLPTLCEYLETIVPSSAFWNVCSNEVMEECIQSTHPTEDDDDPLLSICLLFQECSIQSKAENNVSKAIQFLHILTKTGIRIYKDIWSRLLSDEHFKMKDVLLMFGKRPKIADEVNIARRILLCDISELVVKTLDRVYGIDRVKTAVHAVFAVLKAFKVDLHRDTLFSSAVESFNKLRKGAATEYTFVDVRNALEIIFSSIKDLSDNTINIMDELGKSTSLIGFLQEIVDEDIRNLIDAVEDISEQQVRESTVSALIEVKRYIQPVLIPSSERTCQELIQILETQTRCSRGNPLKLPAKIADCMGHLHNLKSLYNNVANRGEQTKEMIRNIIQRGTFVFQFIKENDLVEFEVNYKQNKTKVIRQRSTLIDLRSRALLLMNSERKDDGESHFQPEELSKFVHYINLCLDIAECLFELYSSGHIEDMRMRTLVKPADLNDKKESLNHTLKNWLCDLQDERENHFLMNFIHGPQIHDLYRFLEGDEKDVAAIHTLLKFIHPLMQVETLREFYQMHKRSSDWNDRAMLHCIGSTLHRAFQGLAIFERPITVDTKSKSKITDIVQTSKLLVAQLEEGSINTVKTVLGLYSNTTQRLPEPNQVLFCTRLTTRNELDILIRRCLGAESFYTVKPLFCIANVELLPNEMQFNLVDTLRHLGRELKYLLALVCRGSRNHPFIDELNEYVTSVTPATDKTVRQIFHEHCTDVLTITSEEAGQGKTSLIYNIAHESKKGVVTLHISGLIRKYVLVEKLLALNVKDYHVLHIDIGSVEDPTELDTFLFELVVLRYVSAGKVSFNLRTKDIKIEIANTINDTLRNALQTAMLFTRRNIEWHGIDTFVVSKEMDSPTQVVCMYLDGLEKNVLNKVDLMTKKTDNSPLSKKRCRHLLQKYIGSTFCTSYPVLHTFLSVLADQLKKLSQSSFFRVTRLRDIVGTKSPITVKSKLVHAMIQMSREFAKRSVTECREAQISTIKTDFENRDNEVVKTESLASSIVDRVEGMIRWEESNHLVFVFHNQNIQTLSAVYRKLDKVEDDVKFLFESQMKKKMADFSKMSQVDLQNMLQKVARINPLPLPNEQLTSLAKGYALTADNVLKMVLIMLRIKANVPVIVMGETGCGKTSLIRYLAQICEVKFDVMNIHAGVSADEIVMKVQNANELALKSLNEERWLFLDEINTSESICMMGDIICHHTCLGKELSPNLVVLGACNPYRLRTSKAISTAGLDSKVITDELSRLVYRVLPLPEMLVDYVWDFGSLSEQDENKYIFRMTDDVFPEIKNLHDLLTNLLSASQAFVREKESSAYSVSLRDVQRCKHLTKWFMEILPKKGPVKGRERYPCDIHIKAVILALAHCYHSRFADKILRKDYRKMMSNVLALHGFEFHGHDEFILGVIKEEQKDILDRMELPPGTACNTALQENVFVILVCIFNRIPIFVVGKPGCSKSLAMQLIRSNLRGKDSKDDFFKSLPQLYCVSFQGSESSTSDGIFKVFEKAEKYQISNSREDVLSVVILDEIGLAEISRFNPLKVLHNLLEPDGQSQPNVAVVGISNWALDASKMNRAIHLSRTEMDVEELFDTAMSISESFLDIEAIKSETLFDGESAETAVSTKDIEDELYRMAEAYFRYIDQMRFKNFHGLRDYYSLVKYVARMFAEKGRELNEEEKADLIVWGLERNFGGLPAERQTLYDVFRRHVTISSFSKHTVIDLITQNIQDPIARHLMLITTGESVLGIIEQKLNEIRCDRIEVIYGSQFEEDLTDDYNYRILSRIILCMEEGVILILKDLESIYGSLYDMLNQNYTVIGKKKNCRVALGPYSNPICHVSDTFRCIVLIDESKLDMSDPPFLNRFEKQYLRFFDIIGESQKRLINEIESWIDDLASPGSSKLSKHDVFPMYSEDMVASLVLKHDCNTSSQSKFAFEPGFMEKDVLFRECQKELLWVIKPEIIVRIKSTNHSSERHTSNEVVTEYFSLPIHGGLSELILYHTEADVSGVGILSVVFTNSNVHTKISLSVGKSKVQVEKIGAFKSEKQLSSKIQAFWEKGDCSILIVQCNAKEDERHIMLTKLVIERNRRDYQRTDWMQQKHVYLIIHLDRSRGASSCITQLNFLSDWKLVMLDSIECPEIKLPELCSMTLLEAIQEKRPLYDYLKEELFWAFTRIKYGIHSRDVNSLKNIISKMESSSDFLEMLDNEMWNWIWKHKSGEQDKNWQKTVACDATLLNTSSSFVHALENFVLGVIKTPLSKFIYMTEFCGVLDSFFSEEVRYTLNGLEIDNSEERRQAWISLLHCKDVFSLDDIPDETGPECYTCHTNDLSLQMPFSLLIFENIEETKDDFLETVRVYRIQCLLEEDEEIPREVFEEVLCQQENFILQKLPDLKRFLYKMWGEDYFDDFCNICSYRICPSMPKQQRINYSKLIMTQHIPVEYDDPFAFVIRLHTTFWVQFSIFRAEMMLIEACLKVVPGIETDIENILSSYSQIKREKLEVTPDLMSMKTAECVGRDDDAMHFGGSQKADDPIKCVSLNDASDFEIFESTRMPVDTGTANLRPTHDDLYSGGSSSEMWSDDNDEAEEGDRKIIWASDSHVIPAEKCEDSEILNINSSVDMEGDGDNVVSHENVNEEEISSVKATNVKNPIGCESICDVSSLGPQHKRPFTCNEGLVQMLCRKMIPTTDSIKFHGSIHKWYSRVSCALSLAYQVTRTPKLLYSLRVCTELSADLIIPFNLERQLLEDIGNLLDDELDLDSNEVFQKIKAVFNATLKVKPLPERSASEACVKMLSSYLIMCISSEPETSALDFMFSSVQDDTISEENMHLLGAPLCLSFSLIEKHVFITLLQTESGCESDNNSELDSLSEKSDDCAFLEGLDKVIISLFEKKKAEHKFIVLVTDLFQDAYAEYIYQNEPDKNENSTIDSEDKYCLSPKDADELFLSCHILLRENVSGISYIAAIAYFKAYVDHSVDHLCYQEEETFDKGMSLLDAVLSDECNAALGQNLKTYFMKMLSRKKTMCRVEKFCNTYQSEFKFLQQVEWMDGYLENCFEKSPLCRLSDKTMHKELYLCNPNLEFTSYKLAVEKMISEALKSTEGLIYLFSVVIREFYLFRVSAPPDDTSRTKATLVLNEVIGQKIEGNILSFIKCLTGEENFYFHAFDLTEESTENQFYKVDFFTSLYALGLGHFSFTERKLASVPIQCLCFPVDLKTCLFPGFPNKDDHIHLLKEHTDKNDVSVALCSCGNLLAYYEDKTVHKCAVCNGPVKAKTISDNISDCSELKCGLLSMKVALDPFYAVRSLQPVSCHVLQLITKACLLGSTVMNSFELPDIANLIDVPEIEVCRTLWESVSSHWNVLSEMLNVEDNMLFVILQTIVFESLDLLFKVQAPRTPYELSSWEHHFEFIVSTVLQERFTYVRNTVVKHDSLHGFENAIMEQRIFEVDNSKEDSSGFPTLYRVITIPSKQNFLSELYPQCDKFQLLTLVLQNEERMKLPQHIFNIINWHMATIANANYILKKSECLKMSVQDFIYNKHERENERSSVVWDRFESFRESWEYLMEHIETEDIVLKMKRIHSESKMSECLLLSKNSVVNEVLQTLVEVQNKIITEMLAIANKCAALKFLFRDTDVAVVASIPVTDVKKEELLACNIDWEVLLRQESQCDLRYGHGRYIHYDFNSIEQSVAIEVMSGKAYIQMSQNLPRIVFIDELHKNYSSLIRELKYNICQEPLPSEIANGIKSRKDEDPRMATELLTHLGIVMSLLKKTKGDPERPLVEYVDGWKSLLTRSFPKKLLPSPETSVKLCHVVGLSELLEELCADSVKNGLSDNFRCKLDGPLMDQILKNLKDERLAIAFLKALKRFTFRCLSSRTATANQSLREYLSDDTFWPDGYFVDGCLTINEKQVCLSKVVPDGLMVRHTFACLTTVEQEVEKRRQGNIKLTTFATSFQSKAKSSPSVKAAEKKRKATKYRKF